MPQDTCQIGLIGLGVMGGNLVLNMADHGFSVAVYNRTRQKTDDLVGALSPDQDVRPGYSLQDFVKLVRPPRPIVLMVKAGQAVDAVIGELAPLLDQGDLIVDAGNSHFIDTDRRSKDLAAQGLHFFGMGVSGGERGARHGPSIMVGGPETQYERVRAVLETCAAHVDGEPCAAHLGPGSAGHYVKMVHNGIEYGLMQILAESYDLMKNGAGLGNRALADVYHQWNQGRLAGFLVEITADIFRKKDEATGQDLIDVILDEAGQKGTGRWTSHEALDLQTPIPTIDAAVTVRNLSALTKERRQAAEVLTGPKGMLPVEAGRFIGLLEEAVFAAMVITFAQGLALLHQASRAHGYGLNLETVARIWRGGCIIRAALLKDIALAYGEHPGLPNLLLSPTLGVRVREHQQALRQVVKTAVDLGLAAPGLASALAYYDTYRRSRSPINLVQAQRDYFGSHTYKRTDREGVFHTEWEKMEE